MARRPQKPHVRFEFGWMTSDKLLACVEEVGPAAVSVWTMGTTHCVDKMTDGRIGGANLRRFAFVKHAREVIACMVKHGVLHEVGDDQYEFHDFLQHNDSREEIEAAKAKKASAGRKGGLRSGEQRASTSEAPASADSNQERSTIEAPASPPPKQSASEAKHSSVGGGVSAADVSGSRGGAGGAPPAEDENLVALTRGIRDELSKHEVFREFTHEAGVRSLVLQAFQAKRRPADVVDAIRHLGVKATLGAWAHNRVEGALNRAVQYAEGARGPAPPSRVQPGEGRAWTSNPKEF